MKDGKPVIGLTCSYEKRVPWDRVFIYENYMEAIRHFGGIPLMIPVEALDEELDMLLSMCDGLVMTGGNDIHPSRYGEAKLNATVKPTAIRDRAEWKLCDRISGKNMPVLGICRGMQFLNVYYGGTLYQDIPAQLETSVLHAMEQPYIRTCHDCILEKDSPLYDLIGQETVAVNSHHHQSVKDPAPGFRVMGRCSDGVVEAMWRPDEKFMWCVQWHPERIWKIEEKDGKIWQAFMDACRT